MTMKPVIPLTAQEIENQKLRRIASEAFFDACPEDPYDLCPCGCGKKFRYIFKDEQIFNQHEETFIKMWLDKHAAKA